MPSASIALLNMHTTAGKRATADSDWQRKGDSAASNGDGRRRPARIVPRVDIDERDADEDKMRDDVDDEARYRRGILPGKSTQEEVKSSPVRGCCPLRIR